MAKLNDKQQRLLNAVSETLEQIQPSLDQLRRDYLEADYRAKAPVRDAIKAAQEGKVPFIQITMGGMGFTYPGKLQEWLRAPDVVVERKTSDNLPEATASKFEDTVENVRAVVRDPATGKFEVTRLGSVYVVPSFGPSERPWTSADPAIPQGVYDLIKEEFPMWELLEDED